MIAALAALLLTVSGESAAGPVIQTENGTIRRKGALTSLDAYKVGITLEFTTSSSRLEEGLSLDTCALRSAP